MSDMREALREAIRLLQVVVDDEERPLPVALIVAFATPCEHGFDHGNDLSRLFESATPEDLDDLLTAVEEDFEGRLA